MLYGAVRIPILSADVSNFVCTKLDILAIVEYNELWAETRACFISNGNSGSLFSM